jgi:hypothetical protein
MPLHTPSESERRLAAYATMASMQLPMTDRAVASGARLKTLTRGEGLTVMASIVLDSELDRKRSRNVIAIADEILKAYYTNGLKD